jgi:hypothetical protein
MFRDCPGFVAQHQDIALIVALDYDQWKILLLSPAVLIDGGRKSDSIAAKDEARRLLECYIGQQSRCALPAASKLEWNPLQNGYWLTWQAAPAAPA